MFEIYLLSKTVLLFIKNDIIYGWGVLFLKLVRIYGELFSKPSMHYPMFNCRHKSSIKVQTSKMYDAKVFSNKFIISKKIEHSVRKKQLIV